QIFSKIKITGKIHIKTLVGHFSYIYSRRRSGACTTNQLRGVQQIVDILSVIIRAELDSALEQAGVNTYVGIDVFLPFRIWISDTGLLEAFYNGDSSNRVV